MNSLIPWIHKSVRDSRIMRRGATKHPDQVPMGLHKEYLRFPRIELPQPETLEQSLSSVLQKRHSAPEFLSERVFTEKEIGALLGHALGTENGHHRSYPSGGALFPIETYLIGHVFDPAIAEVYHYHPKKHALEHLWSMEKIFTSRELVASQKTPVSSTMLVFTAAWERSSAKYGDLSYSHGLIEAGHMGQNIQLVATALGIRSRPVAGFDDAKLSALLDIDNREEQPVYSILIAPK